MLKLTLVTNDYDDRPDPGGPAGVPKYNNNDGVLDLLTFFASRLGAAVILVDCVDYYGQKANGLYMVKKGRHMIYLDKHLKGHGLRFVLAHELAHLILHTGKLGPRYRNDPVYRAEIENEANDYAGKLLAGFEGRILHLPETKSVARGRV